MTSFSIIWTVSVAIISAMATLYAKWIKKLWALNKAVKAQNKEISIADAIDQEKFHNSILYLMLTFVQEEREFNPDSIQFIVKYIFEAIPEIYQRKALELLDYYTKDASQTSRISVVQSLTEHKATVYRHITDKTSYKHHVNKDYSKNLNDLLNYTGKLYVVHLIARLICISSQRTHNFITTETLLHYYELADKDLHIKLEDYKPLWRACSNNWNSLNIKSSTTDLENWYAYNIIAKDAKYPPFDTLGNIHHIEKLGLKNQKLSIDISQKNKELNKKLNYLFTAALIFCTLLNNIISRNISYEFDSERLNDAVFFCFLLAMTIMAVQIRNVHQYPFKFIRGTQNTKNENFRCLMKTISGAFIFALTFILVSNSLFQLANYKFASHGTFERYLWFENEKDEVAYYNNELQYYDLIPFRISTISPEDMPSCELTSFDKYITRFLGLSCFYREQCHFPIATVYERKDEITHNKFDIVSKKKIYVTKGFYSQFYGIVTR